MFKHTKDLWYISSVAVVVGKTAQKIAVSENSILLRLPSSFWERLARVVVDVAIINTDFDLFDCRIWGYPNKWVFACYASSMLVTTHVANEVLAEFDDTESLLNDLSMISLTTFENLLDMIEGEKFRSDNKKDDYLFEFSKEIMAITRSNIISGLKEEIDSLGGE